MPPDDKYKETFYNSLREGFQTRKDFEEFWEKYMMHKDNVLNRHMIIMDKNTRKIVGYISYSMCLENQCAEILVVSVKEEFSNKKYDLEAAITLMDYILYI